MGIEALGFDQRGAMQSEASRAAMLCRLLEDALLGSLRCGKNPDLAISQDAVDVEQDKFDFWRALWTWLRL